VRPQRSFAAVSSEMTARPRVYLVNLSFGLAGIERRFANVSRLLRARGNFDPILVVPETAGRALVQAQLVEPDDPGLVVIPERPLARAFGRLRAFGPVVNVMSHLRARVVAASYRSVWRRVEQDSSAVIHLGLNCSSLRPPLAPSVYECVDSTLTNFNSAHYRRASRRPCIVHCQTGRIRSAIEAHYRDRRPIWETVTSPSYFARYVDPPEGMIKRDDPLVVAFVGRFSPEKSPFLFLDALKRVADRGIRFRALMLGEGPLELEVRSRLTRLQLADRCSIEFHPDPYPRLLESSIYVSLQTGDNFGSQALLEAMGAGCAVVASNVGETSRLVRPEGGLLVGFDANSVSAALSTLLTDPGRVARMGHANASLVRREYSANAYVTFLEELYERAFERFRGFVRSGRTS
jgi:glycosyltransferase involved in cell wall biosynthesis